MPNAILRTISQFNEHVRWPCWKKTLHGWMSSENFHTKNISPSIRFSQSYHKGGLLRDTKRHGIFNLSSADNRELCKLNFPEGQMYNATSGAPEASTFEVLFYFSLNWAYPHPQLRLRPALQAQEEKEGGWEVGQKIVRSIGKLRWS